MKRRIDALRRRMAEDEIDCVIAVSYHHSYYLSGAPIFPFGRPVVTMIPLIGNAAMVEGYLEKAHTEQQSWIKDLRTYWDLERPPWESALRLTNELVVERGLARGRIGFEDEEMPVSYLEYLRKLLPDVTFVGVSGTLNSLRLVKSDEELDYVRMAGDVADAGMEKFLSIMEEGKTAREISRTVYDEMTDYALNKYPDMPFMVLASSGMSHTEKEAGHSAGWVTYGPDQKVERGLNYGGTDAWVWGYWGNVERNLIVGGASAGVEKHFRVMVEMHEAAIATAVSGRNISDIDRAAKDVLRKYGYETRQYGSGCARGLATYGPGLTGGRELKLDLRQYNESPLMPGMIFSVEPEMRTEVGTFRHSTTVLVTENGNEVWSRVPRTIISV
jgi:Xaa-Pro aminopeptidase